MKSVPRKTEFLTGLAMRPISSSAAQFLVKLYPNSTIQPGSRAKGNLFAVANGVARGDVLLEGGAGVETQI